MTTKVGINGLTHRPHGVPRRGAALSGLEIGGINDLLVGFLAYMLRYDSVHGRFRAHHGRRHYAVVNGKRIRSRGKDPAQLQWGEVAPPRRRIDGAFLRRNLRETPRGRRKR